MYRSASTTAPPQSNGYKLSNVNGRILNNSTCKLLDTDGRTLENNRHEQSVVERGDNVQRQVYVCSDMWVGQAVSTENFFFFNFVVSVILLTAQTVNCGLVESSELIMWKNYGTVQTQYYIVLKEYISRHFLTHPRKMEDTNTMN